MGSSPGFAHLSLTTLSGRFSKLFMSHLDNEFKKQLTPSLQTLISDQASHVAFVIIIPLISHSFKGNWCMEPVVTIAVTNPSVHLIFSNSRSI